MRWWHLSDGSAVLANARFWHIAAANAAASPQLAKADFASSSQHVREGQRIAALDAEVDALQRQTLALGAEPTADVPPWFYSG
jgi:hypothetical protein